MIGPQITDLGHGLAALASDRAANIKSLFLSPGSTCSLAAGVLVLFVAVAATLSGRRKRRNVPLKVLVRALFPKRLVRTASGRADIAWFIFNVVIAAGMFGWAIVSSVFVERSVHALVADSFRTPAVHVPGGLAIAAMTLTAFLAYEFAYWLDHSLSHRIPLLWAFHKVHHSAESLSPLTNFRVHPVDTIVFYNIVALVVGSAEAVARFLLGPAAQEFTLWGANALLLIAGASLTHLQHTHLWISFSGRMGRLLLSPAHHQIHHSTRPIHFNRNFGSTIALWDALFGTLHVPAKKREKLTFGVDGLGYDPHSAKGGMLMPIADAWGELRVTAVGLAARLRPRPAALIAPTPLASAERSHALLD